MQITRWCISLASLLLVTAQSGMSEQAKIGDLFSADQFSSATEMSKPTLKATGGTLILSDSPEEISDAMTLPGAFYRDKVCGEFRVFYHHQNAGSQDLMVGVAITNTSKVTELLFAHGRGAGVNVYPDVAGQMALAAYMSSRKMLSLVKVLKPGESYFSVQENASENTASGFEQYLVLAVGSTSESKSLSLSALSALANRAEAGEAQLATGGFEGLREGSATVTTLAYVAGNQPASPTTLSILAADTHIRGSFPHFNREGNFTVDSASGLQYLAVSTAAPGLDWSDPMPGEYEYGTDTVDGGTKVYNDGNYGVLYSFNILFTSKKAFSTTPMGILMQPTGGAGEFVMKVNRSLLQSDYVDYTEAWWIGEINSDRYQTLIKLETSLTGGSSGPQELLFDPGFTGK